MFRSATALPFAALLLAAPLAAQDARDFQLPPAASPTAEPRVQGPVDSEAPVPVRPRPIETARPAPSPTASNPPAIVLPPPAPTPAAPSARAQVTARQPAAAPNAQDPARPVSGPPADTASVSPSGALAVPQALPQALPLPNPSAAPLPGASPIPVATSQHAPLPWLWIAIGAAVLAAGGAFLFWRRRTGAPAAITIAPPIVPQAPATPGEALAVAVQAVRMDRSVLNATVGYRITVRNRTAHALSGVAVEADLVSASRDRPTEQQLASPDHALTPRHAADRLAPGQSLRFEGQVRLPLSEASAIWQGRAALLVPLLRVRAIAAEALPVATTLVIGRSEGQAARPQPFRLDEPPRSYSPLAQRVLDGVAARA